MPDLYYTVTRNEIRPDMSTVPVLVSAAGWTVPNQAKKNGYRLRVPPLPEHVVERAADCGAFVATTRWGGHYRFSPDQYVGWLMKWQPKWAATMDLCCVDMDENGRLVYPGKEEVRRRQQFTTEMAYFFWSCYQELPVAFCPTIQGWHPEEYVRHAQALASLITEMFETYWDGGCTDYEQEQEESRFRVGIGSLCGRDPLLVHEIVSTVQAIIGLVPLHLWGTKLRFLQSPRDVGMIASMDSAVWNGLWGENHEDRRQSGLSEARYCWNVSYPRYAERVAEAKAQPKFPRLIATSTVPLVTLEEAKTAAQVPLSENLRYRKNGDGPY
jgi:hypothetical protein